MSDDMRSRIGSSRCGLLLLLFVAAGAGAACSGTNAQVPVDGAGGAPGMDAAAGTGATGTGAAGTSGVAGTSGAGTSGVAGTGGAAGTGVAGTGWAGTDGSTGVAGTGGGGTGGTGLQLPGCLRDLFATCPMTAPCSYEPADASAPQHMCYASGASSVTEGFSCTTSGGGQTTVVRKADGSLCYTRNASENVSQACEIESYRWTDASGALVATATVRGPGSSPVGITVGCAGGAATLISTDWSAANAFFGHEACTADTCP